jgi:hypothetical protein
MTTTRILPGMLLVLATAGPAAAQHGSGYGSDPNTGSVPAGLIPSVAPTGMRTGGAGMPARGGWGDPSYPAGRPVAAAASANPTALDRVTASVRPASAEVADPSGALAGDVAPAAGPVLPTGAYPSPYYTDGPGCCGPLGRNGRIGYEIYAYTGPAWTLGEGRLSRQLQTGWLTGGGGRSLFFNPAHDAAWVVDLGLSYQYNRGSVDHFTELFIHQPPIQFGNQTIPRPDVIAPTAVRGLHRTNFNFALGRDWWMWGPGSTGMACGWNVRVGGVVGGRYGTAHVDLLPQDRALGDYQRRQGVTHGVFISPHATVEVPMGSWIGFCGLRAEWGYDWMNLVPPIQGNLHSFNLLFTAGIRF